ncbi:MAG: RNA degradosome polyphosphate kinase, partial [Parascardovia denticolens]
MTQKFTGPSKEILRSQIAEHIAEIEKAEKNTALTSQYKPLPDDRFFDREISWLKFNKRVLELAQDPTLPLLERTNFEAIFASNLDEFFMVRVAGLKRRINSGIAVPSASGMSPRRQMREIAEEAHQLQDEHARYFRDALMPALRKENILIMKWEDLTLGEQEHLSKIYRRLIFPV